MSDCHPVEITVVAGGLLVYYLVLSVKMSMTAGSFIAKSKVANKLKIV